MNDGHKDNPTKHIIRQLYLDFLDVPADSPRRTNPDGIYYSFQLKEKVLVIMLDVRWNRDPKNATNPTDVLGSTQWHWLDAQLSNAEGEGLVIIASGSQIIHDDRLFIDSWYEES